MVPDVYNGKTKIGKPNCEANTLIKMFQKKKFLNNFAGI